MSDSEPTFQIEKIYVKDLSLELPNAPQVFMQADQPQLEVQIANQSTPISEGFFEVTVSVTVTAKAGESTLFLVEVVQAGIFQIVDVPAEELDPLGVLPLVVCGYPVDKYLFPCMCCSPDEVGQGLEAVPLQDAD